MKCSFSDLLREGQADNDQDHALNGEWNAAIAACEKSLPNRETIAEAIWRGSGHWTVQEWPLRKVQQTMAWENFLRQADAVISLWSKS